MAKNKVPVTLVFDMENETPNTVRFEEQGEKGDKVMGKIYIRKTQLKVWGNPRQITITVTPS